MKLKLSPEGHAVVENGMPVYVHDDGKDVPFDAVSTVNRISALNAESKGHREAKEAAALTLKAFADAGIGDPAEARKALDIVKNLDAKKLVDAGKVEEVMRQTNEAWQTKFDAADAAWKAQLTVATEAASAAGAALNSEMIGGSFSRSKFVADKLAIPADLVQAKFGHHFKIEGGKLVAVDASGGRIYSRQRPGDANPDFDEALEIVIGGYAHKDAILKGSGASGSGASGSGSGATGTRKKITRQQYDAMPIGQKQGAMAEVSKGTAELVDA